MTDHTRPLHGDAISARLDELRTLSLDEARAIDAELDAAMDAVLDAAFEDQRPSARPEGES